MAARSRVISEANEALDAMTTDRPYRKAQAHGAAIAEGTPETVVREPAVVQSYLGAEAL